LTPQGVNPERKKEANQAGQYGLPHVVKAGAYGQFERITVVQSQQQGGDGEK